jgi:hypothetical protein
MRQVQPNARGTIYGWFGGLPGGDRPQTQGCRCASGCGWCKCRGVIAPFLFHKVGDAIRVAMKQDFVDQEGGARRDFRVGYANERPEEHSTS